MPDVTIDGLSVDWKAAPVFPPDYVRATLSFVFRITDEEVHIAVVDEDSVDDDPSPNFAAKSVSPVGTAIWLTGRKQAVAHGISMTVFWQFWREYAGRLDHPLRSVKTSPRS